MKKPYYLYARRRKDGKKVFYVKFRTPDGEYLSGRSTGETDPSAAEAWAIEEITNGRVRVRADIRFDAYAKDFFLWDGPYVKHLRNRGRRIGQIHAAHMDAMIKLHLNWFFGSMKLSAITTRDVERWQDEMLEKPRSEKKGAEPLTAASINHALISLRTVMKQAVKDGYINSNPCQGVEKLASKPKTRGALTEEEGAKLFADPGKWSDQRQYWICRLSYEVGLRLGEAIALQRRDIENGYINVVHSWGAKEGLKEPKTKRSKRRLRVSERITTELKRFMDQAPFQEPNDFVFYTPDRSLPYRDNSSINRALYSRMREIKISDEDRTRRNIVFHSLRHSFNTRMRNSGIPDFLIQAYMGHSSPVMTDNYTDVMMASFDDVVKAQERVVET
jgi:integrase